MLNWFHEHLGFGGSILITFFAFILGVCWLSGLAGMSEAYQDKKGFSWPLFLGVFVFPIPIVWLIVDMVQQHRYLHRDSN